VGKENDDPPGKSCSAWNCEHMKTMNGHCNVVMCSNHWNNCDKCSEGGTNN